MARHLRDEGIRPDLVLCSPARRARETLETLEPALEDAPVRTEEGLYDATTEELLDIVRRLPADIGSVMLIAHNPGLQDVATMLAGTGRDLGRLHEKYPTCALATLQLGEAGWSTLQPGGAELVSLVTPNDLA
jgi:phosphohistidine phosphatase